MAQGYLNLVTIGAGQNLSANGCTKVEGTGEFVTAAGGILGVKAQWNGTAVWLSVNAIDSDADRDDIELLFIGTVDIPAAESGFSFKVCYNGATQVARYTIGEDGGVFDFAKVTTALDVDLIDTQTATSDPATTKQAIRFRVNSTAVTYQVRRWNWGLEPEPTTWDVFDFDAGDGMAALAVGSAGIDVDAITTCELEWFSWGTNSASAPSPGVGRLTYGKLAGHSTLFGRLVQ